MPSWSWSSILLLALAGGCARASNSVNEPAGVVPPLSAEFVREVDRRLEVPADEQLQYADKLSKLLAPYQLQKPQYVVLVDRSEFVQAALIYWFGPDHEFHLVGASPVSTGKPGQFDHFFTPLGVFEHSIANLDFRALGTKNELGIRGYGRKGMRIFDFGWQNSMKGWGKHEEGTMRLQMHATDPDILEKRLGTVQSKGCIRIPATLNSFLDRHGILDADYADASARGQTFWVLAKDRVPTEWPGRYLVTIESAGTTRPDWVR